MAVPPGVNGNNEYVRMGYLPATIAPYNAQGNGVADDLSALEKCVDDARDYGFVAILPGDKTYAISDTLKCMQELSGCPNNPSQDRREAIVLVGSTVGARPIIKLRNGAGGFGNPGSPKPAVWIWARPRDAGNQGRIVCSTDPNEEQANIAFNDIFRNIDIDVSGFAGAIGLRFAASQGSGLYDCKVTATGAYAGFYNIPGQGAGAYNIEVVGGEIGVIGVEECRFPLIAGAKFTDQTDCAIRWGGQSCMVVVGAEISTTSTSAVIDIDLGSDSRRSLALVDTKISMGAGTAIKNNDGYNVHLDNVYVSGATNIIKNNGLSAVAALGGWSRVKGHTYTGTGNKSLINGTLHGNDYQQSDIVSASPPADLRTRHIVSTFPSVEDADIVSIDDYGAVGNDSDDATSAINAALSANTKVFVPVGIYKISGTIELSATNQLIGVAKNLSVLRCDSNWNPTPNTPMIRSANNANATTIVGNILLDFHRNAPKPGALHWRSGRNSIVRELMPGIESPNKNVTSHSKQLYRVTDNGGGRWYSVTGEMTRIQHAGEHPDYRIFLADGTHEPLKLYALNVERSQTNPQSELRNSQNVTIYYCKGETKSDIGETNNSVMEINNCTNIKIYGHGGNAKPTGGELYEVNDGDDIKIACISQGAAGSSFFALTENYNAVTTQISGSSLVALYKRGDFAIPEEPDSGVSDDFFGVDGEKLDARDIWSLFGIEGQYVGEIISNQVWSRGTGGGTGSTAYQITDQGDVDTYMQVQVTTLLGANDSYWAVRMVSADTMVYIRLTGPGGSGVKCGSILNGDRNGRDLVEIQGTAGYYYRLVSIYGTDTIRFYSSASSGGPWTQHGGDLTISDISNAETRIGFLAGGTFSAVFDNFSAGPLDTAPPASVTDLATGTVGDTSIPLTWTAPGADGNVGTAATYDVRYSTSTISEGNWSSATPATGEPSPSVAGTTENFTVGGLSQNTTYYFAIKTTDAESNESGLSNIATAATLSPDSTAPAAITDLSSGDVTTTTIDIGWTAPGDDGSSGQASSYDIRLSTSIINEGNWSSATQLTGEPSPSVSGTIEAYTATGLTPDTEYYFAIKTSDEVPNESGISNVISVSTAPSIAMNVGAFAMTGNDVSFAVGYAMAVDTGSFSLGGKEAIFKASRVLSASTGSIVLMGFEAFKKRSAKEPVAFNGRVVVAGSSTTARIEISGASIIGEME